MRTSEFSTLSLSPQGDGGDLGLGGGHRGWAPVRAPKPVRPRRVDKEVPAVLGLG
jgi:hypothetical protein